MRHLAASSLLVLCTLIVHLNAEEIELQQLQKVSVRPKPTDPDPHPHYVGLCECQTAMGSPAGLSCEKEGWFVAGFENVGQWSYGSGYVPLSHAVCCRPCVPELPPEFADTKEKPVAVVSIGCHTATEASNLKCEVSGGSFVFGFTEAVRVLSAQDAFYPVNGAQCCTPALLLDSGDVWELERCECHTSSDPDNPVSCGEGELLSGFDFYKYSSAGHRVPISPAHCCKLCISETPRHLDECTDLNDCRGHGVCALGRCECAAGWAGADCSFPSGPAGSSHRIPPWGVVLIVLGSLILTMLILLVAGQVVEIMDRTDGAHAENADEEAGQRALLSGIDDDDDLGSVGSEDTVEDLLEEVEERIQSVVARLEQESQREEESVSEEREEEARASGADDEEEHVVGVPAAEDDALEVVPLEAEQKRNLTADWVDEQDIGPLASVCCAVCMIRPVQTVIVPCGHVCMCRRCSRRLTRCPICRKEIVRRQRLFV